MVEAFMWGIAGGVWEGESVPVVDDGGVEIGWRKGVDWMGNGYRSQGWRDGSWRDEE